MHWSNLHSLLGMPAAGKTIDSLLLACIFALNSDDGDAEPKTRQQGPRGEDLETWCPLIRGAAI